MTLTADRLARVEALFQGVAADAPGCAIGIIENGETLLARGYGLASLEHRGLALLEHSGGLAGYGTQLQVYPSEGFGVVAMRNDGTSPQRLSRQVAEICLDDRMSPPRAAAPAPAVEALRARAACYRRDNGVVLSLAEREGKLYLQNIPFELQPLGPDTFAMGGDPDIIQITFDAEGGFALSQGLSAPERFRRCEPPAEIDEDAFVGDFHSPELGAGCSIRRSGRSLAASFARGAGAPLQPIDPDCLGAANLGVTLTFQRDASGAAHRFIASGIQVRGVAYSRVRVVWHEAP